MSSSITKSNTMHSDVTTTTGISPNFTVMTYNVYVYGYKDSESQQSTLDAIANSGADIVCLQESNAGWEECIRKHDKILSEYSHIEFLHHRWEYGGKAILSKHPVRCSEDGVSKEVFWGWYPGWRTEVLVPWLPPENITVDNSSQEDHRVWVQILHLHLRAIFPSNPLKVQQQRREEVAAHWKLLRPLEELPTIVLGDFNTRSGPATKFVLGKGKDSASEEGRPRLHPALGKGCWKTCQWKIFWFHYDHIFVDHSWWKVESASVPEVGGSDHRPVVATLVPRKHCGNSGE